MTLPLRNPECSHGGLKYAEKLSYEPEKMVCDPKYTCLIIILKCYKVDWKCKAIDVELHYVLSMVQKFGPKY